ncbi:hypothetical protein BVZ25_28000 [Klebsiella quasipneumoniae]|jgi:hypothetical protein|nr:hypothetical protein BVZ25_28000 [Klebsiella quasipneumoniae]
MMSLWDALRMNMMISYQELVRTFPDRNRSHWSTSKTPSYTKSVNWQHHPNHHILNLIRKAIKHNP